MQIARPLAAARTRRPARDRVPGPQPMIVGIGVDVLDVARMERELRRDPRGIRIALFTPREIAECDASPFPARSYATRFAAKEALFKALDARERDASWWREAEVFRDPHGETSLTLRGRLERRAAGRAVRRILVSLSSTRTVAAAAVLLENTEWDRAATSERGPRP